MKKLSLVLVILLMSTAIFAQEDLLAKKPVAHPLRNEIGINLFSVTFQQQDNVPGPFANILSGIYYKYHFGQNALRFSFDYQGNVNQISQPIYENSGFSHYTEQFKLGYQRSFGHKRLSPFVYVDAYAGFMHYRINMLDQNYLYTLFGAATGAGLRYKLNAHIAFSYEFAVLGTWDKDYHYYTLSTAYFNFSPIKQLGISFLF